MNPTTFSTTIVIKDTIHAHSCFKYFIVTPCYSFWNKGSVISISSSLSSIPWSSSKSALSSLMYCSRLSAVLPITSILIVTVDLNSILITSPSKGSLFWHPLYLHSLNNKDRIRSYQHKKLFPFVSSLLDYRPQHPWFMIWSQQVLQIKQIN